MQSERLEIELAPHEMRELHEAAKRCQLSPRLFTIEAVESALAARRLPQFTSRTSEPSLPVARVLAIEEL